MTKALSLTVFADRSNVTDGQTDRQTDRRTDRQNWYSNSQPDAARYALASIAKTDQRRATLRYTQLPNGAQLVSTEYTGARQNAYDNSATGAADLRGPQLSATQSSDALRSSAQQNNAH